MAFSYRLRNLRLLSARFWSVLCAVLFLPTAPALWVLTFLSERASRCLTYGGERCGSLLPGWLFTWGVGLAVLACVIASAAPTMRVRRAAFVVQLLSECAALLVILSFA
ncbi:hypothetical protein ACFXKX_38495 [Streptomyces scopuliridis]|uniref:hypothetical protein n=1 Tax=Streptomyces scopuliridis TaxID=452529 RepID=UPI00369E3B07